MMARANVIMDVASIVVGVLVFLFNKPLASAIVRFIARGAATELGTRFLFLVQVLGYTGALVIIAIPAMLLITGRSH